MAGMTRCVSLGSTILISGLTRDIGFASCTGEKQHVTECTRPPAPRVGLQTQQPAHNSQNSTTVRLRGTRTCHAHTSYRARTHKIKPEPSQKPSHTSEPNLAACSLIRINYAYVQHNSRGKYSDGVGKGGRGRAEECGSRPFDRTSACAKCPSA